MYEIKSMQWATSAGIGFSDFSISVFKVNHVFAEEDNLLEKPCDSWGRTRWHWKLRETCLDLCSSIKVALWRAY